MIEGCIGAIREQPTAYDVDMVLVTKESSRCLRDSTRRDLRTVIK